MDGNVGFFGPEIAIIVLERALTDENPSEGVEVLDRFEPSEVYDCARDRDARGTVRFSELAMSFNGDGDRGSAGVGTLAGGIGSPWTAATSWASVQLHS